MHVRPSVRPHETARFPLDGFFVKFDILSTCQIHVHKIQVSFKSDKNNGYFIVRQTHSFVSHSYFVLRMKNVSNFDVLLTVHLRIFIPVINQLDDEHMCSKHVEA